MPPATVRKNIDEQGQQRGNELPITDACQRRETQKVFGHDAHCSRQSSAIPDQAAAFDVRADEIEAEGLYTLRIRGESATPTTPRVAGR